MRGYVAEGRMTFAALRDSKIMKKHFESWAHGLNGAQRFWYDIDIHKDGKISVSDVDAYLAFVKSQGPERFAEIPGFYYSIMAPNAEQTRAAQLLAAADTRIAARKGTAEAAQKAANERRQ